jgi:hypothetical protein
MESWQYAQGLTTTWPIKIVIEMELGIEFNVKKTTGAAIYQSHEVHSSSQHLVYVENETVFVLPVSIFICLFVRHLCTK